MLIVILIFLASIKTAARISMPSSVKVGRVDIV